MRKECKYCKLDSEGCSTDGTMWLIDKTFTREIEVNGKIFNNSFSVKTKYDVQMLCTIGFEKNHPHLWMSTYMNISEDDKGEEYFFCNLKIKYCPMCGRRIEIPKES